MIVIILAISTKSFLVTYCRIVAVETAGSSCVQMPVLPMLYTITPVISANYVVTRYRVIREAWRQYCESLGKTALTDHVRTKWDHVERKDNSEEQDIAIGQSVYSKSREYFQFRKIFE